MTYRINGKKVSKQEFDAHFEGRETTGFPMINSFQPFLSPIDNKMITNRKELQEHNTRHGVVQVGNEYINKQERELCELSNEKEAKRERDSR